MSTHRAIAIQMQKSSVVFSAEIVPNKTLTRPLAPFSGLCLSLIPLKALIQVGVPYQKCLSQVGFCSLHLGVFALILCDVKGMRQSLNIKIIYVSTNPCIHSLKTILYSFF